MLTAEAQGCIISAYSEKNRNKKENDRQPIYVTNASRRHDAGRNVLRRSYCSYTNDGIF